MNETNMEAIAARGARLQRLTHTGPATDMGKLLRLFWQPVALSRNLAAGNAQSLRILAEELTLYRGTSGEAHLVGALCAHRLTLLNTGWVDGDRIRCMYHGWQYDGTGACTERPAERDEQPPNIRIAGYPVKEYAGLIFAYMGPGDAPAFDLPRKDVFEDSSRFLYPRSQIWNCNWFQMNENSLDAVHVSFVHQKGRSGSFIDSVSSALPELEYFETEAGIRQIATRGVGNVRVSDWTFPNNNHINVPGMEAGDPWMDVGHWNVPIDDEHTYRFNIQSIPSQDAQADSRIRAYLERTGEYNPANHHEELFSGVYPEDHLIELTSAQDYVAQRGQGVITDRTHEILGRSDAGVAFLRKIFAREIDAIVENRPTKSWRPLEHAAELPVQKATAAI